MKPEYVRGFRDTDAEAVEALLLAAFGGPGEAGLVRALRASGALAVELVLPWEGRIIAHVGLSRMVAPDGWLCLAPLAVAEAWRGRRLGVRMAKAAVSLAVGRTVVVLGEPAFYARAGFSVARAAGLVSPYGSSQTLIARPGDDMPEGELIYPAAFAGA
jgi:putative acetyltransferase